MKRLLLLLAIAVLSLVSSAPLTASPPTAADHPAGFALAAPALASDRATYTAPAAFDTHSATASVPGVKRVGSARATSEILAEPTFAPKAHPGLPPARAVPLEEV